MKKTHLQRRLGEEKIFNVLMLLSLAIVLLSLFGIVAVVIVKGISALNLDMLIKTPKGGYYLGKEGGIANAIVGSFYLTLGGLVISILLSLPIAFVLQGDCVRKKFVNYTRIVLDLLWGIPSIVYGAFAFVIMQFVGLRASLLGGMIVLSLVMLPIMTRAIDEILKLVPLELKEASYALGTTKFETCLKVVFRQAVPGIVTAVLLAFGRGIGDAASVMFTAGYTDYIPRSLFDAAASLPLAVFFQLGTPIPEVQQRAYASALILLVIVLLVSVISRILSARYSKYTV